MECVLPERPVAPRASVRLVILVGVLVAVLLCAAALTTVGVSPDIAVPAASAALAGALHCARQISSWLWPTR